MRKIIIVVISLLLILLSTIIAVTWYYRVCDELTKASDAASDLAQQFRISNGVLVGDGVSGLMSHIDLMYGEEVDITKELERRIELRRKGEKENKITNPTSRQPVLYDGTKAKEILKNLEKYNHWYVTSEKKCREIYKLLNKDGSIRKNEDALPTDRISVNNQGTMFWRNKDGSSVKISKDEAMGQAALYQEGLYAGKKLGNAYSEEFRYLLENGRLCDFYNLKARWMREVGTFPSNPKSFKWNLDDVNQLWPERGYKSDAWRTGIFDATNTVWGEKSSLWLFLETYDKNLSEDALTQDCVIELFNHFNSTISDYQ